MSTKENDAWLDAMRIKLIKAIEDGNKKEEERIRQEINDSGLVSLDDDLEQYL